MKRVVVLATLFLSLFFLIYKALDIRLKSISCLSQYGPCNDEVALQLEDLKGQRLFFSKKKLSKVMDGVFLVESFVSQYRIPSTLEVRVVERKPTYAINYKVADTLALVDKEGYALSFQDYSSLPKVSVETSPVSRGQKVKKEYLFSVELIAGLTSQYNIETAEVRDNSLYVGYRDLTVIFPLSGEKDVLLGSFVAVISKLNSKEVDPKIEKVIKEVDLRFENPVLR